MKRFLNKNRRVLAALVAIALVLSTVIPVEYSNVFASDEVSTMSDAIEVATDCEADSIVDTEEVNVEQENAASDQDVVNNEETEDKGDRVLSADLPKKDGSITITASYESLPYPKDSLSLSVRELEEDTLEYYEHLSKSAEAIGEDGTDGISFARFFDIEILVNGEKVEPETPVEVKIEYDNSPEIPDGAEMSVVHFADEGTEVINDVLLNKDATELTYEQDSFSVTGTIVSNPTTIVPSDKGKTYALVAYYNNQYYLVKYDGTLSTVTKSGSDITADTMYMWTYISKVGKYYLRCVAEGYDYNDAGLPTTFGYTYIDPTNTSGISTDEPTGVVGGKTEFDSPVPGCAISIDSNGYIQGTNGSFLAVKDNGKKIGSSQTAGNEKFYLVEVSSLPDFFEKQNDVDVSYGSNMAANHQVNHIDISIRDKVTATIPLAYGTYYDKDGNKLFTVTSDTSITVTQKLNITQDTLRNAKITAYDKDGNELNNAFAITGYSSNPADNNNNTVQVRIEGMFKVSTAPVVVPDWFANKDDEGYTYPSTRKNNPVSYSLEAEQKNVEFKYITDEYGQLYDSRGNALSITTDVVLNKDHFGYFDDDNTCPAVKMYKSEWEKGKIWNTGTTGMDFLLEGATDIQMDLRPVAIEINNDVMDSNGNIIKPSKPINNVKFNIKQNTTNPNPDEVKGQNIDSYTGYDVNPTNYTDNVHTIKTNIDTTGSGLEFDNEVYRGMVYVEEDIDTVPETFLDSDGNLWVYRYTYIETEYVNRLDGNEKKKHVTDKSTSGTSNAVPEVLGEYQAGTTDRFSSFVEFFAHNVYDKVDKPSKKETSPYNGNGVLGEVNEGDSITYEISYYNYKASATTVTISDQLDSNVEYVILSKGGFYDSSSHKVTWTINNVPADESGKVTLTVKVKPSALASNGGPGKVVNGGDTATVKIGTDEFSLEKVENPVKDPEKKYDPKDPDKTGGDGDSKATTPKDPEKKETKVTNPPENKTTPNKSTAKTGDSLPFIPVIIVMIISGVGIVALFVIKRRRNRLE